MPETIQLGGKTLVLNGMGTRKATVFKAKVYVAGLYLEEKTSDPSTILEEMGPMRISLALVRDVERDEMNEAIREGFERNAGGNLPALQARMRQFEQLLPDLDDGDRVNFTYRPEAPGYVVVHVNGRVVGRIQGEDFAKPFFAIWLGPRPPNAELKRGLLGGEC